MGRLQLAQAGANSRPARPEPVAVVVLGAGQPHRLAQMDQLAGGVALGLEQHRIHAVVGLQSGRPGLQRLGVGHFAAVLINPGVVAHVLPLEGQGRFAATAQHPAEGSSHKGLASPATGAKHHQGPGRELAHLLARLWSANHRSNSDQGSSPAASR